MPRCVATPVALRGSNSSRLSKKVMPPRVLHRAAEPARQGDEIELRQWIGGAEIVVEIAQQPDRAIEGIAALLGLPRGRDDAHHDAVGIGRQPFQLSHREDEQVARHPRRCREFDALEAGPRRLLADGRHVRDGEESVRNGHCRCERGLEGRLVPARKDAARIRRFEMGGQHALAAIRDRIVYEERPCPND